jgi:hypothetical protein
MDKFRLYAVQHRDVDVSYVPTENVDLNVSEIILRDAARECPRTLAGRELVDHGYVPGDPVVFVEQFVRDLASLIKHQEKVGCPWLGYSVYDDESYEFPDIEPKTTYLKTPMIDGKLNVTIREWMSEESYDELERSFFTHPDPASWFLDTHSVVDLTEHFFYHVLCKPRSFVADAIVYDKRYRCAVIKTKTSFRTMSMTAFADEAIPWIWTMMERLCVRILAGCRNDENPAFVEAHDAIRRFALKTLRILTADLGCGPTNTVHRGHPEFRKFQRKGVRAVKVYADLRDHIVHDLKMAADESIGRTFEKLRRIYPRTHERAPDFAKHKIELNKRRNSTSLLDLFKPVNEVITITPELRADAQKLLKTPEDSESEDSEDS